MYLHFVYPQANALLDYAVLSGPGPIFNEVFSLPKATHYWMKIKVVLHAVYPIPFYHGLCLNGQYSTQMMEAKCPVYLSLILMLRI